MADRLTPEEGQLSFDAFAEQLLNRVSADSEGKAVSRTKAKVAAQVEAQAKIKAKHSEPRKAPGPVTLEKPQLPPIPTEAKNKIVEMSSNALAMDSGAAAATAENLLNTDAEELEVKEEKKKKPDVLTVGQLNKQIKSILEKTYPTVWVKGEISNFKVPASGHMYFTLKDETSQIPAVMFNGFTKGMKFKPADGMEVLVRAKVTVYEPRGNYQLFCEVMEPVGFGALQIAFEQLKAQLAKEGLFDPSRKKAIPPYASRIGIVTSPTGAAIRDMLNVLGRRSGGNLEITIIPTSVQGDKAPGEIVAAIELANKVNLFDVLIIGRGGGSLEDLWSFNTEIVARAIAASKIPTISAVGHEVDFTIADFVADLRAPTPSAAAELVCKNKDDLVERIELLKRHIHQQMRRLMEFHKQRFNVAMKGLVDPKRRLQDYAMRTDELTVRLGQSVDRFIADCRMEVKLLQEKLPVPTLRIEQASNRLSSLELRLAASATMGLQKRRARFQNVVGLMDGLSPLKVLERGYSIVKKDGEIIKRANQVSAGDTITITLSEGELSAQAIKKP